MIHRKKVQHSSYHVPKVFFLILKKICQINMTVQVLKKIDHFNKNYFRLIWHLTIQSKNAISCLICVRKFPREMMFFYGFFMISKLYLCFVQCQIVCSVSAEVVREGMIWGQ